MTDTIAADLGRLAVPEFIKGASLDGRFAVGPDGRHESRPLPLDQLVWLRSEPGPAFATPLAEIIDFMAAAGVALAADSAGIMAEAADRLSRHSGLPLPVLQRLYQSMIAGFRREALEYQVERELRDPAWLDGWERQPTVSGREFSVRAHPSRLLHIMAGNAPGVAVSTIIRGALTKSVNLLKLPSNDLFTAPAILRTMESFAPGHPTVRSFSAVYWRGGDAAVESALFRPQYFDKVVAWGGEAAIRGALRYIGPGLELIAFDPKSSISIVAGEALGSAADIAAVAALAAQDVTLMGQDACSASRFIFVDGDAATADAFCAALQQELAVERPTCAAVGPPPGPDLLAEIESVRMLGDLYRVWGRGDGRGIVVRSDEPVDFFPAARTVNVVVLADIRDAAQYVSVGTSTVGVHPASLKSQLRDALADAGAQRIVRLGRAGANERGMPHDGMFPLHRMIRWVNDEG